ncbi:hypothetical protein CesoFtcFv8_022222 [Champsocephalus esox]|uniref:Uncharacterized protein n=1 Tax=Champsocephalus esox TaxID=159716 RepID=A0AAN8GJQ8_9TELE|nr:hypothetical protein CesoFtcFv8_022222 [Champsocephalus esox]
MLRLFPKRWKADSAVQSQRVSKVITTATASGRPGKEQGLINDNARSAGGEEPKWAECSAAELLCNGAVDSARVTYCRV